MRITQSAFSHTHGEYEFHPSMQACISPVNEGLDVTLKSYLEWNKKMESA